MSCAGCFTVKMVDMQAATQYKRCLAANCVCLCDEEDDESRQKMKKHAI